jgi:hypothetical protein
MSGVCWEKVTLNSKYFILNCQLFCFSPGVCPSAFRFAIFISPSYLFRDILVVAHDFCAFSVVSLTVAESVGRITKEAYNASYL